MGCLYEFCNRFLHNSYGSCTAFPVGFPIVYDGDDDDDDDDDDDGDDEDDDDDDEYEYKYEYDDDDAADDDDDSQFTTNGQPAKQLK